MPGLGFDFGPLFQVVLDGGTSLFQGLDLSQQRGRRSGVAEEI